MEYISEYDWSAIWNHPSDNRPVQKGAIILNEWTSGYPEPVFVGVIETLGGEYYSFAAGWGDYEDFVLWFGPAKSETQAADLLDVESRRYLGYIPFPDYEGLWVTE